MTFTVEQAMQLHWQPEIAPVVEEPGCFALRVPPIADFVIYGTSEERLLAEWREALQSHLSAYIAVGKAIPRPMRIRAITSGTEARSEGPSSWARVLIESNLVTDIELSSDIAQPA